MAENTEKITGNLFSPGEATLVRAEYADWRWSTMRRPRPPGPVSPDSPVEADPDLPLHIYDSVRADFERRRQEAAMQALETPASLWFPGLTENTETGAANIPSQSQGKHALRVPAGENITKTVMETRPGEFTVAAHVAPLAAGITASPPERTDVSSPISSLTTAQLLDAIEPGSRSSYY